MPPTSANLLGALAESSHERILHAAKSLFAERGYENTSTAAIARKAGSSQSQLIKHFGSKEGVLEAIFDEGWARLSGGLKAVDKQSVPGERLHAMMDLVLTALERDPELKELMLLEGRRVRKEGHMIMLTGGFLQFVRAVDAVLEQMQSSGQMRREVPVEAARSALIGLFAGLLRDQLLAQKMGYPARYGSAELRKTFDLALASFLTRS